MKIFKIFTPIEQLLDAVSGLFNSKKTLSQNLLPVRVKSSGNMMMRRVNDAQGRPNQKITIL